jgi:hypothetical protein
LQGGFTWDQALRFVNAPSLQALPNIPHGVHVAVDMTRIFPEATMQRILIALPVCLATLTLASTPALAWDTPARGSADRRGLMDAMRPHAEALFGAPVEFVIQEARVGGGVAFVMLQPQRPGGVAIDVPRTPFAKGDSYDPDFMDGIRLDAFLQKSGTTWVMIDMAVGATDAWFASTSYCATYAAVLPEVC